MADYGEGEGAAGGDQAGGGFHVLGCYETRVRGGVQMDFAVCLEGEGRGAVMGVLFAFSYKVSGFFARRCGGLKTCTGFWEL